MVSLVNNLRSENLGNPNSLHGVILGFEEMVRDGQPAVFYLTPNEQYVVEAVHAEHLEESVSYSMSFPGNASKQVGDIHIGVSATHRGLDVQSAAELSEGGEFAEKYWAYRKWEERIRGNIAESKISTTRWLRSVYLMREAHRFGDLFPFAPDFEKSDRYRTIAFLNMNPFVLPEEVFRMMEEVDAIDTVVWSGRFLYRGDETKNYTIAFNEVAYLKCAGERDLGVLIVDNSSLE